MLEKLFEALWGNVYVTIFLALVTAFLLYVAFLNEEKRKDYYFTRLMDQLTESYEAEKDRKNSNDWYTNLIENPTEDGIDMFIREYPQDIKIPHLIEIKSKLILERRKRKLWDYVRTNEYSEIDSLLVLNDLLEDSRDIEELKPIMAKRFLYEISEEAEYLKVMKFMKRYPNDVEKRSFLFSTLDKFYFLKFQQNPTHWNCLEYLDKIPPSFQSHRKILMQELENIEKLSINISVIENSSFMSDAFSIEKTGYPIIAKFGKYIDSKIQLSMQMSNNYFDKMIGKISDNTLLIYSMENGRMNLFSSLKLYRRSDQYYLETKYNSKNGYFKLLKK